jgi:hypothetical protein
MLDIGKAFDEHTAMNIVWEQSPFLDLMNGGKVRCGRKTGENGREINVSQNTTH